MAFHNETTSTKKESFLKNSQQINRVKLFGPETPSLPSYCKTDENGCYPKDIGKNCTIFTYRPCSQEENGVFHCTLNLLNFGKTPNGRTSFSTTPASMLVNDDKFHWNFNNIQSVSKLNDCFYSSATPSTLSIAFSSNLTHNFNVSLSKEESQKCLFGFSFAGNHLKNSFFIPLGAHLCAIDADNTLSIG